MAKKVRIVRSKGNIFADLGLDNANELNVKSHLAIFISKMIQHLGLTQGQAATKMGVKQPDVSKLLRGNLDGFSLERLLGFVRSLGSDIEIKVGPVKKNQKGKMLVDA
ncbi:helix-turn-helix transcriptional regulator [Afipia carboxidovorans]|uniref:helix-turn-helix domain-containing protein n=1 Tax=Afipia carboxidovorans TaxID=40137 RepID=UPI003084CBE2|nr:helix-turn-helix transcriptional regulator [Afipia carboxidovorans]